jgi:hypothetical protein
MMYSFCVSVLPVWGFIAAQLGIAAALGRRKYGSLRAWWRS